ncbi:hypothetical protein MHH93_11710 [Priestia sp. FSL H7-0729]
MIQIKTYSEEFEREYWTTAKSKISSSIQSEIIKSCEKFLPSNFFEGIEDEFKFKVLILSPFEKLSAAEVFINTETTGIKQEECFDIHEDGSTTIKGIYKTIHDSYELLANSKLSYSTMRVRIVKNTGLTVCPYCNRDYINCRAPHVSGAQLDHFFSRSVSPLFAICLYNLIPVCGNCNRVKSSSTSVFASPFDNSIDWGKDLIFSYTGTNLDDIKITLDSKGYLKTNIDTMRIEEAYQIHGSEVLDLIEREQMYNSSQKRELIDVLGPENLTDNDIKKIIFGPEITREAMRTKPLGKMMHDLHKELKIYSSED